MRQHCIKRLIEAFATEKGWIGRSGICMIHDTSNLSRANIIVPVQRVPEELARKLGNKKCKGHYH
uniref:Uncharacterized protein n=1 Tax=Arundo donax TaxID=35708 RepID=A0A0A9FZW1_ARUDO